MYRTTEEENEWQVYMEHIHAANAQRKKWERKHQPKKPVVEMAEDDLSPMWDYRFQAKHVQANDKVRVLASDSLVNLKQAIRERGWSHAWLTTTEGRFSYRQRVVDEYYYVPRR